MSIMTRILGNRGEPAESNLNFSESRMASLMEPTKGAPAPRFAEAGADSEPGRVTYSDAGPGAGRAITGGED